MALNVQSISSDGLVFCYDPSQYQFDDVWNAHAKKALCNILKSQGFDSIPLIMVDKSIKRIARRRLHDGDLDEEVFILDLDECAVASPNTTILEAIFTILSNEHHILFILDDRTQQPISVLTMSMLNSNVVKEYLRLKILSLHKSNWDWNKKYLGQSTGPTLDLADEIFHEIKKLANLVNENKPLQSDKVVSEQIVRILTLIQPLKDYEKSMPSEKFSLTTTVRTTKKFTVEDFMSWPAASLTDDDENVLWLAYQLFSKANNWENLLLKQVSGRPYALITGRESSRVTTGDIERIKPSAGLSKIIDKLKKNGFKPLFTEKMGDKWPGIITPEDVILNQDVIMEIILQLSTIEEQCRTFLLERNHLYVPYRSDEPNLLATEAPWNNVIIAMKEYSTEKKFPKDAIKQLNKLRKFRNKVIHEYLPLVGSNDLPKWMGSRFTEGYDQLN